MFLLYNNTMRTPCIAIILLLFFGCTDTRQEVAVPTIDMSQLAPEASAAIERAIKDLQTTGSAENWTTLGLYLQAHGMYLDATLCYEAAINLPNTPTKSRYWLALSLAKLGKYDQAISNCSQYENYTPAYWRRGYWLLDLGKLADAKNAFSLALEANPKAVAAMVGIARVQLQMGNANEAIVLLEDIRNRGGNHPYLSYLLGTAYQRAGLIEKATPLLLNTGVTPPKWEDPWFDEMIGYKRGFAAKISEAIAKLDNGNPTGALTSLALLAKLNPRHPTILTNLANVQLQLNQISDATKSCSDAIRWNPNHSEAQLTMAQILFQSGNLSRAEGYIKKAIELRPTNSQAHSLAGKIALRGANVQQAARHFEQAIAIGSNNPSDREMLGMSYLDLRKYEKAADQFALVIQTTPNATLSIGGLVVSLSKIGQPSEAARILQKALSKFPNDPHLQRAANSISQQGSKQ